MFGGQYPILTPIRVFYQCTVQSSPSCIMYVWNNGVRDTEQDGPMTRIIGGPNPQNIFYKDFIPTSPGFWHVQITTSLGTDCPSVHRYYHITGEDQLSIIVGMLTNAIQNISVPTKIG